MAPTEKLPSIRLLAVDDDEALLQAIRDRLERKGIKVATASSGADGLRLAEETRFDLALLDVSLPDINGVDILTSLKEQHPEMEVIMRSAAGCNRCAVEAMNSGAYDYVVKPFHFNELEIHIQKAFEKASLVRREKQWVEHLHFESPRYRMVGSSVLHLRVMQLIEKVAPTDATVLICGASGTGKELVAHALHYNSPRRTRPLVTVNCAALQETLLESEVFGHEKGAFTGAVKAKPGLIEVAEGGTLFIDEVAEMSPGLQSKLLRVLENGHYRRVGSTHEGIADVRIIAATNRNLKESQKNGKFREDLYYRLNVVTIPLPTLNDRKGDLHELVQHFLSTRQIGPVPFKITPEAMEALTNYDWPGNIRELANILERAQILAEEHTVTLDDLPENLVDHRAHSAPASTGDPRLLREIERLHVIDVLRQENGTKAHAAKVLGISRRALYRLIKKYHLTDADVHI
ncbi:MAG: sigma-54-dependent Fis family transcriptional regulator [Gemmataceae bacterium]|nr:sigma-54-dependent Fis family transcriptional regulator [Gemmataceae bacterium]